MLILLLCTCTAEIHTIVSIMATHAFYLLSPLFAFALYPIFTFIISNKKATWYIIISRFEALQLAFLQQSITGQKTFDLQDSLKRFEALLIETKHKDLYFRRQIKLMLALSVFRVAFFNEIYNFVYLNSGQHATRVLFHHVLLLFLPIILKSAYNVIFYTVDFLCVIKWSFN